MAQVWLVPLPFLSHVINFGKFARLLALGGHGLRITIFVAPADLDRLRTKHKHMLDEWERGSLHIQLRELESPAYELGATGVERFVEPWVQADEAFARILTRESRMESRPTCIFADLWMPAAREIATKLEIPCWTYSSFMTGYVSSVIYIARLEAMGMLNMFRGFNYTDEAMKREAFCVPGLPVMRCADLCSEFFPDFAVGTRQHRNGAEALKSEVLVFSGFRELEAKPHRELTKLLKIYGATKEDQQILHVGPVIPFLSQRTSANESTEIRDEHECLKFLNQQQPKSTLFVAFGSDASHPAQQIVEIAHGLEDSQQPFICVLHPPEGAGALSSILPHDLVERVRGRGMFVESWAPQLEILAHPFTGAFMSHCGWNSVLESLSLGVPILAWPFQYEQMMNCRFLVDAELAMEVDPDILIVNSIPRDKPVRPVSREAIARSVRSMLLTAEGAAVKGRALEMQRRAEAAVGQDGSSTQNLQTLVHRILALAKSAPSLPN